MGERFVVVPVGVGVGVAGEGEHSDAVVADPAPDTGSSCGGGTGQEEEAGEDSVFETQDPVVPILEYNREPNKYGKTAVRDRLRVPLLISSIYQKISRRMPSCCVCAPVLCNKAGASLAHNRSYG